MWVYDLDTLRFLEVNEAAVSQYGYSREEFLKMKITDIRPAEDVSRLLDHMERKRPRLQTSGEWRHRCKDGHIIDVQITSHTLTVEGRKAALVVPRDITEQKHDTAERMKAEEALRRSEQRFRALIENSSDAITLTRADGTVVYASPATSRLLGYSPDEYAAQNPPDLLHPDDTERIAELLARLIQQPGISISAEFRLRHKDGSWRWMEGTGTNLLADPSVQAIVGNYRDVTVHKQAETLQSRLAAIVESADDAIYGSTLTGIITSWNAGAARMYGYGPEEIVGRSATLLVPPDKRDEVPRILQQLQRGESLTHLETVRVRKDGTRIEISLSVSPIRNALGDVIGGSIIARDITERKKAERVLRESEERYRSLFNGVPVGLYRATPSGEILEANDAMIRMLGCPDRKTFLARGAANLYVDPQARVRWIESLSREGTVSGFESQLRRYDGTTMWARSSARAVHDGAGRVAYFEGAVEDITGSKRAEEAVQRAGEADRANRAKNEFLSRMSHELRTPLNAILGFAQLLELDHLTPEQAESVGHILKGGQHLLELINEVLDIARIESGRMALSLEPVLVHELIQESLQLAGPLAAEAHVRLSVDGSGLPDKFINADRQRVKQVLLNLLSNAVKYNRKGGTVTLSCEDVPGNRLRIKVADTGSGISEDGMKRLFTPFDRLGAERTHVQGTGLGLALSKNLVEAMGGTLGAESTVGKGSTFWGEFALTDGPLHQLEGKTLPLDAAPLPAGPQASAHSHVLLYVEDNLSNLKLIERVLAHRPQVKLLSAMQGRLSLDLAREHRPHLILLDLNLPDIPGTEVLSRLRAEPATQHIPVVVVSADATPGQIDRLLANGARSYLTKPIDVSKFLAIVDEILREGEPNNAQGR
jgi:PAS domain S-box-containing protein